MKPYLLLRNNVQSGPYSADELRMLGLKAFDLIWTEGKSFSWKYPAEVDELRSFAPAVEQTLASVVNNLKERQMKGDTASESVTELKEVKEVPQVEAKIVPIKETKTEIASSQLSHNIVAFPPKIERVEAKTIKSPTLVKVQVREKEEDAPASRTTSIERKYEESFMPPSAGEGHEEVQLETKFAQPLDNIRDKFIESRIIRAPKEKSRNILETSILIIGAVSLLGIGYLFGTSDKNKQQPPSNEKADAAAKDRSQKELYELLAPERTTIPDPVQAANAKKSQSNAVAGGARKERIKQPLKPAESSSTVAPSGKNNLDVVVEKDKPAVDEKKEYAKQHINELVSVKNSDYKRKFLGGISGLKFTVTNGSAYTIDEVSIEVSYIKNNDEVFKTETVSVKNLWPGAVYTADAPSTNKGVKVTYKVSSIRSKELGI